MGGGGCPCMCTSSASVSPPRTIAHQGETQLVSKQGGAMSVATAVPRKREETEIYLCTEAELVKNYKVCACMMVVLQRGSRQEMLM